MHHTPPQPLVVNLLVFKGFSWQDQAAEGVHHATFQTLVVDLLVVKVLSLQPMGCKIYCATSAGSTCCSNVGTSR